MIVNDKFKDVPIEKDTRVLRQKITTLGNYEVMHQKWFWDGIKAESVIFTDYDVEGLSESEIKELVKNSLNLECEESSMTFSQKGSGYTFVNFNFKSE